MSYYRPGDKGTIVVTVIHDGPDDAGDLFVEDVNRFATYVSAEAFTLTERAAQPLPPEPEWPHIVSRGKICWTALDGGLWRSTIGDRTWEHIWTHYRPVWPLVPGAPIGGDA